MQQLQSCKEGGFSRSVPFFIKLKTENADKNSVELKHSPMDSKTSPSASELLLFCEAPATGLCPETMSSLNGKALLFPASW